MAKKRVNKKGVTVETVDHVEETVAPFSLKKKPSKTVSDYFEIIGEPYRQYLLANGDRVDFRFGIPSNALELYKSGFPYLGLKSEAVELFAKEPASVIRQLITPTRRGKDVEILKKSLKL